MKLVLLFLHLLLCLWTLSQADQHTDIPEEEEPKQNKIWMRDGPDLQSCEVTFNCLRYSPYNNEKCLANNCPYFFAYPQLSLSDKSVHFFLSSADSQFVAIGFTDDKDKRLSDIVACIKNKDKVEVKVFFWSGERGSKLQEVKYTNQNIELLNWNSSISSGPRCTIRRSLAAWDPKVKDLEKQNYYHEYLWGRLRNGIPDILYEDIDPTVDWESSYNYRIDFKAKLGVHKIANTPLIPSEITCNSSLSCARIYLHQRDQATIGNCNYRECSYQFATLGVAGSKLPFFLSAANAEYVALGLTGNPKNSDIEIVGCKSTEGKIVPFHYWVTNKQQRKEPQIRNKGLKIFTGNVSESGLWCNLAKTIRNGQKNQNLSSYLLYMWGRLAENTGLPIFWDYPSETIITDNEVNLNGHFNRYQTLPRSQATSNTNCKLQIISVAFISYFLVLH